MNFNFGEEFSFEKAAEYSRIYAQKKSPKASKLLDLITPHNTRSYLNLCFTYLRFVDDAVDNSELPVSKKIKFIEHQKKLITLSFDKNFPQPESIEEACLFYYAEFAISNNKTILLEELKNMTDALGMDAARLEYSGIFSKTEFDSYINKMAKSLFNILYNFLVADLGYLGDEFFIGKFTANAQMIRDLEEDIDGGYVNFSREEIEAYKIDLKNIKEDKNLRVLIAERTVRVWKILWEETSMLKDLPLMFRTFTFWSFAYYLTWIIRAKEYDYDLRKMHEQKFIKEVKTYFKSFLVCIKIIFKGFIFTSLNDTAGGPFFLFSSAVRTAEIYTHRRAPRLWMLIKVLIPKKARKFEFLGYAYLKWADDFADNPEIDKNLKKEFIEKQLNLLDALIHNCPFEIKNNEEYFLYHLCKCAEKENPEIILYLKDILESIKMDIERLWEDGIFSSADLKRYIELQTKASFNLIYIVLQPDSNREENNFLGRFLWQVRMMKDFQEDLKAGYLNISREESDFYRFNSKEIMSSPNIKEWVMHNYAECMDILKNEMPIIKFLSFKPKIVFAFIYQALFLELIRVKEYNYTLNDINKKKVTKEIKTYFSSLILTLKFYLNVFLDIETNL